MTNDAKCSAEAALRGGVVVPEEREFKMQDGPNIPRYLARIIYAGYAALFGTDQSLERIEQRGGFGRGEVEFLWKNSKAKQAMLAAAKEEN